MKPMKLPRKYEGNHDEAGFSLLETCVALVIMMIVGLAASSMFLYSITNNTSARDRQLSMAVAQQQMERLRNAPFANLNSVVTSTGGTTKTVTSAGRQYQVVTSVAANADGSMQTITVQAKLLSGGPNWASGNFGGVTLTTQRATNTFGPNR